MQKSRKVNFKKKPTNNLNYLLNFNYDHHDGGHDYFERRHMHKNQKMKEKGKVKEAFNSSHFTPFEKILAKYNCTVITPSDGVNMTDYLNHFLRKPNWDSIFSFKAVNCGEKCSICLDDLVFPKITKCGHIYCTVCLDRLLHFEEKQVMNGLHVKTGQAVALPKKLWLSCPLCCSMFLTEECKRINFLSSTTGVKAGDHITLALFQGSEHDMSIKSLSESLVCQENKVMQERRETISKVFDGEKREIRSLIDFAKQMNDSEYHFHLTRVLAKLQEEETRLLQKVTVAGSCSLSNPEQPEGVRRCFYKVPKKLTNVFLHPFNLTCLEKEKSSSETNELPEVLKNVKVLKVTAYSSITEEFRRKYAYLRHLLPASEAIFVEVDLGDYLSDDTREFFDKELKRRKLDRLRERRYEKKKLRHLKNNSSIKADFQQQLLEIEKASGPFGSQTSVHRNNAINDDLKEFLRSEHEEDNIQSSQASIKSFAKIVDKNGYFPALVTTSPSRSWASASHNFKDTNAWVKQVNTPNMKLIKSHRTPGSKKTSRKHRVELFSTSGGRRYK